MVFSLLVYPSTLCMPGALGVQNQVSGPLGLAFQTIVSRRVVLGVESQFSARTSALNHCAISLAS